MSSEGHGGHLGPLTGLCIVSYQVVCLERLESLELTRTTKPLGGLTWVALVDTHIMARCRQVGANQASPGSLWRGTQKHGDWDGEGRAAAGR